MSPPGWYPDPSGGGSRYWDGTAWTGHVPTARRSRGIPGWVLVGWWLLWVLAAVACWWFVLLMVTFGCDSGWAGCVGVGNTALILYAALAVLGLLVLLVVPLVRTGNGTRIVCFVLMPIWVVVSIGVTVLVYWLLATITVG
jgi:hypothetical protein